MIPRRYWILDRDARNVKSQLGFNLFADAARHGDLRAKLTLAKRARCKSGAKPSTYKPRRYAWLAKSVPAPSSKPMTLH